MQKKDTRLIRLSFWMGAIFDAVVIFPMLSPQIAGAMFGIPDFHPGIDYRYAMGLGAALMAGWTVLLLWADRKPWERRDILLLTLFPVLTGLILAGIDAVRLGFIRSEKMAPTWFIQGALVILYLATYLRTRFHEPELAAE